MLPVSMHGITTDARCAKVVHIAAGGSLALHERVTIPAEWTADAKSLILGGVFRASVEGKKGPFDDHNSTIQTLPADVEVRD
jgi:hypothetical protein